jgi:hypothetical protein
VLLEQPEHAADAFLLEALARSSVAPSAVYAV